jgi:hypothetical protein
VHVLFAFFLFAAKHGWTCRSVVVLVIFINAIIRKTVVFVDV